MKKQSYLRPFAPRPHVLSALTITRDGGTRHDGLILTLIAVRWKPVRMTAPRRWRREDQSLDFFFFEDAGRNQAHPEDARTCRRGTSKKLDTQKGGQFEALRARTSYVYILANYGATIDHSKDWKLADLLDLEVVSPILKEKKTELTRFQASRRRVRRGPSLLTGSSWIPIRKPEWGCLLHDGAHPGQDPGRAYRYRRPDPPRLQDHRHDEHRSGSGGQ